ncbi:Mitochondrial translocator assembly and maintenance protein 41 [Entomophthora muscae]|uniref:Mitochondrial translocator assembly and maintenance protein 41 n=1 Tax=Entomophthora muscae TaxID=34485 RepID=A0ACC2RDW1_9FUNG|nr:Mitochondrial translocator assembly and maintenance protein 41 [Entomophthora muscae]
MGDFRMAFGENPNKVANIVKAQRTFLEEIYHPVIDAFPNLTRTGECIVQDVSPKIATLTIKKLPEKFRSTLETEYRTLTNTPYGKEVEYSRGPHLTKATSQALTRIVGEAALTQSVKGFFTAGLTRSFRYVGEKVYKRFK